MSLRLLLTGTCLIITAYQTDAIGQVLLSRYEFNGNLNNSSVPTAENGNVAPNGTFGATGESPTFSIGVDGIAGSAILLDGVNDWIDITTDGHPGAQTPSDLFLTRGPGIVSGTIAAWVRVDGDSLSGEQRWLLGTSNNSDSQSFQFGWDGTQLELNARAADMESSQFNVSDETTDWADGNWHHLAVVWRASTNTGEIYVDGSAVVTPTTSGNGFNSLNTQTNWEFPMAIGARNLAVGDTGTERAGFWEGAIDDLRIYADSLDATDIQDIINETTVAVPDFDSDNDVDGNDFLIWQRGLNGGTTLAEGDANNSSNVDETDLAIWQNQFGASAPLATIQAVPEPGSLTMLLLATTIRLIVRQRYSPSKSS